MKKCKTEGCRRNAQQGRSVCRSCRTVRERTTNLERYSWRVAARNAKRRGIPFTLTFDEYVSIAGPSGYFARKGRFKDSLHMDRVREWEGYHFWNMQTITNSQNVKKALLWRYLSEKKKMEFKMGTITWGQQEGDPF
jgi:transcription initiation factor TFIIIB Brf1 subunit/transcription initiation factor TFIIB